MIEQQPTREEIQTPHLALLRNTRVALDKLLGDQRTQAQVLALIEERQRQEQEKLAGNQAHRAELLEALKLAQLASNKAQASYDLACGTPSESEMEQRLTEAKSSAFHVMDDIQLVADSDLQVRDQAEQTKNLLEQAQEAEHRINERVSIAQSIFDETEALHREAINQLFLAEHLAARHLREQLRLSLEEAELEVQRVQVRWAQTLKLWPTYAQMVLTQEFEIADDEGTHMLQRFLDLVAYVETNARNFDPHFAKLLKEAMPNPVYFKNYDSRAVQREQAKLTMKSPGRGISPDLWSYDTALSELELGCSTSRAENRRRVIESLLYDHEEQVDQHIGWNEQNRTL